MCVCVGVGVCVRVWVGGGDDHVASPPHPHPPLPSSSPPLGMSGHVKQLVHSNPIRASNTPHPLQYLPPSNQDPLPGAPRPSLQAPCCPWARRCSAGQGLVMRWGHAGSCTREERVSWGMAGAGGWGVVLVVVVVVVDGGGCVGGDGGRGWGYRFLQDGIQASNWTHM